MAVVVHVVVVVPPEGLAHAPDPPEHEAQPEVGGHDHGGRTQLDQDHVGEREDVPHHGLGDGTPDVGVVKIRRTVFWRR